MTAECTHTFEEKMLSKPVPTYCNTCKKLLWVIEGKFKHCTICDIYVHPRCYANPSCAHLFEDKSLTDPVPTHCEDCKRVLWVFQGKFKHCTICGIFLHPTCHAKRIQGAAIDDEDRVTHQHELLPETFIIPRRCDVCSKMMAPGAGWQCTSCDVSLHKDCIKALPAGSYTELSPKMMQQDMTDPGRSLILRDVLDLVANNDRRNPNWVLSAINPVTMHSLYSNHAVLYATLAEALPSAQLSDEDMQFLKWSLRFATAAYGTAYSSGNMANVASNSLMRVFKRHHLQPKDEPQNDAVVDILGLPRACLKDFQWSYKTLDASFAVTVDHKTKWVVLAFRGSLSDADFLSDASADPVNFSTNGAKAHGGMAKMVDAVFANGRTIRILREQLSKHADHELVITGHSLGAGLASLFTVRALDEGTFGETKVRCVSFASPPVLTLPVADLYDHAVTTVVGGTDMVCRLQLNAVDRLSNSLSQSALHPNLTEEVHCVGKVVFLTAPWSKRNRITVIPRDHILLHQIFIHSTMISCHLMDMYVRGLNSAQQENA